MERTRRDFLKIAGGAALASTTSFGSAETAKANGVARPMHKRTTGTEAFWDEVRDQYKVNRLHFNTGTTGSLPLFAQENLAEYNRERALDPVSWTAKYPNMAARRLQVANFIGANTDEVYISNNTSDGMNAILLGLEWKTGDEILTTQWEHPGGIAPAALLRDRHGVVLTMVEMPWPPTNKKDYVDAFAKAITSKTKAIMISGIPYKNGMMLPHKEICTLARDAGLISIVDGAHYTGHIEVNAHDIGCDFLAMSGHKWLSGVAGTGICYIRNSYRINDAGWKLPAYWPYRPQGWGSTFGTVPTPNRTRGTYDIGAMMQSVGDTNLPSFFTTADCVEWCALIGASRFAARNVALSSYMKAGVVKTFGAGALMSPDHPDFNTGLLMYNPFNDKFTNTKINQLNTALVARGIYSRTIDTRTKIGNPAVSVPGDTFYSIRVSTHWQFAYPALIDEYLKIAAEEVAKIGL